MNLRKNEIHFLININKKSFINQNSAINIIMTYFHFLRRTAFELILAKCCALIKNKSVFWMAISLQDG